MSLDQPHVLLAAALAVGFVLLALWLAGGLAAALACAAVADLGLSFVERRRSRRESVLEVRSD